MHTKCYEILKKKISREGLTDKIKEQIGILYLGGSITEDEYKELLDVK